jgi:hypothetical protein
MATPVDAKQRAMSTYNAAADFTITRSTRSGSGTVSRPSLAFGLRLAQKFWMSAVEAAPPRRPIGICTSRRRVVHPSTGPPNLMLN